MPSLDTFMSLIRTVEGVDLDMDPNDPGNWTGGAVGSGQLRGSKCGISAAAYPTLDIANLTDAAIEFLYIHDYLNKIRFFDLPDATGTMSADCAVNQGVSFARVCLQESAGTDPDGVIGPMTLAAIANWSDNSLAAEIWARRALRYAQNDNLSLYGLGWMRRVVKAFNYATATPGVATMKTAAVFCLTVAAGMMFASMAHADPPVVISADPITDYLQPAADAMGTIIAGALGTWLIKVVHNQLLRAALQKAILSAGAGVYSAMVQYGKAELNSGVVSAAVATKANAVIAAFAGTMKTLKVTPNDVHSAVDNAFGMHLVADQSVTVVSKPIVTTVIPPKDDKPGLVVTDGPANTAAPTT